MNHLLEPLPGPATRASEHGLEMVTIKTGEDPMTQIFTIHKDLLCKSSDFFRLTFDGRFQEIMKGCLELRAVAPLTFEVLYQWLYRGSVCNIAELASKSGVAIDLLWLRVFTMAHRYMITDLQQISYRGYLRTFHDSSRVVPTASFVQELYESDLPSHLAEMLKSYLIQHCAYWIRDESCRHWEWDHLLKHRNFGADLARELIKRKSQAYLGIQSHPSYSTRFGNHNLHIFIKRDNDESTL